MLCHVSDVRRVCHGCYASCSPSSAAHATVTSLMAKHCCCSELHIISLVNIPRCNKDIVRGISFLLESPGPTLTLAGRELLSNLDRATSILPKASPSTSIPWCVDTASYRRPCCYFKGRCILGDSLVSRSLKLGTSNELVFGLYHPSAATET